LDSIIYIWFFKTPPHSTTILFNVTKISFNRENPLFGRYYIFEIFEAPECKPANWSPIS